MRYVAAYLLAVLGGNTSPSAKDIKAILGSVGIEADDERLNKVSHLTTVFYAITKTMKTSFFFTEDAAWLKLNLSLLCRSSVS